MCSPEGRRGLPRIHLGQGFTCEAKIAALKREAALLEELFRAMLEEMMTGRVRVNQI